MPRAGSIIVIGGVLILGLAGCAGPPVVPPTGQAGPPGAGVTSTASPIPSSSVAPGADARDLYGITWLMTAATVNGAAMTVPGAFEGNGGLTLSVGDGSLGGYDGCNWFGGSATESTGTVTPAANGTMTTGRACVTVPDAAPAMDLTDAYTSFLRNPFWWIVDEGTLSIGSDSGAQFDFVPFPAGFPSELAGEEHPTIAVGTDRDLRYRIYLSSNTRGQDLCVSMEFYNEPGQNQQSVGACRSTDTARQYVVNPTDFHSSTLQGRGLLLSAVPSGTATRIVARQKSGKSTDLTLTPIPGTDYLAFHGFVPDPQRGDKVLFHDSTDKLIDPAWVPYW